MRMTLRTGLLAIAVVLAGAAGFVTLSGGEARESTQGRAPEQVVQRGEYLVKIMGCNDCHTPWKMGPQGPEPDMTRFLSGHPEQIGPLPKAAAGEPYIWSGFGTNTAFTGPWGVSYTFNLTPEPNTGLGIARVDTVFTRLKSSSFIYSYKTYEGDTHNSMLPGFMATALQTSLACQ